MSASARRTRKQAREDNSVPAIPTATVDDSTGQIVAAAGTAPDRSEPERRAKRARPGDHAQHSDESSANPAAAASLAVAPASPSTSHSAALATTTLPVADGHTVQVQPMTKHDARGPWSAAVVREWRSSLERDGYLLLEGLVSRGTVLEARRTLLRSLRQRGLIVPLGDSESDADGNDDSAASLAAMAVDPLAPTNLLSDVSLQQHPSVLAAIEHPRLFDLFGALLQPDAAEPSEAASASPSSPSDPAPVTVWTSAYKWLRGVPRDQCTGFHLDRVYMRGSTPLYSLWLPLGDLEAAHGNLVVCPGSHRSAQFARLRDEYGQSDAGAKGNGTTSGWIQVDQLTQEPVQWLSSPVSAGSGIILDLSLLHCTSVNTSLEYRLSCDTRWTVTPSSAHPPAASLRFRQQTSPPDDSSDDSDD